MEAVNSNDKENSRRPGARSGSVPARSVTPGAGPSTRANGNAKHGRSVSVSRSGTGGSVTPAVRPASAMSDSSSSTGMQTGPNKRQRTISQSQSTTMTRSKSSTVDSSRKAPLGNSTSTARRQNQNQGYDGSSDQEWGVRSGQKGGKTPASTISRPRSAASTTGGKGFHSLSRSVGVSGGTVSKSGGPRGGYGTTGLGVGTTSVRQQRTVSGPAYANYSVPKSTSRKNQLQTQTQVVPTQDVIAAKRAARAIRRESFRPRPSEDGHGLIAALSSSRYAGFTGSPVREEE